MAELNRTSITIDVVADIVCPWCFLGKRRLGAAVAQVPEVQVLVAWRPYMLDPDVPPGGLDRAEYLAGKFNDPALLENQHLLLTELGAAVGIPFDFARITRTVNSLDAHRLVRWSQGSGQQDRVLERLYAAYWVEGRDISDHVVLTDIAAKAGLDGEEIGRRLASDRDVAAVRADVARSVEIGVSGVPTFLIDRKYAIPGAVDPETMAGAIRQVAREKEEAANE